MDSLPVTSSLLHDSLVNDHEYIQGSMCLHCADRFWGTQLYVQRYRVSLPEVELPRWDVDHPLHDHVLACRLLG